ncbi:MAG: C4-dicarboxylate TRAP transporter substrate-binding protein [Betaproteobacteria bacterium]|nr:C4-dicarboxylate TRAP transporter substrate-binding protein [Betaproteobacteria bacterium]
MHNKSRRSSLKLLGAASAAIAAPAIAQGQQTIRVAIGASHPLNNIFIGMMKEVFQAEVDKRLAGTRYKIEWREAYGGTLYKFQETLSAVRDNIVDIGWVGSIFEPTAMPLHNVTYFSPFATDNLPLVISIMDALHDKVPALRQTWETNNLVYLGGSGVETYHLWTTQPVTSLASLKGRKFSTPGAVATFLQGTGAVAVNSPIPAFYTDIKSGVTDGAVSFSTAILGTRVYEVAPYFTRVGIGAQYVGGLAANRSAFGKLPPEVQTVMRECGKLYAAAVGRVSTERSDASLEQMTKAGMKVSSLSADERQKWIDTMPNVAANWVKANPKVPAQDVLKAWMDALRAAGENPARAWDKL